MRVTMTSSRCGYEAYPCIMDTCNDLCNDISHVDAPDYVTRSTRWIGSRVCYITIILTLINNNNTKVYVPHIGQCPAFLCSNRTAKLWTFMYNISFGHLLPRLFYRNLFIIYIYICVYIYIYTHTHIYILTTFERGSESIFSLFFLFLVFSLDFSSRYFLAGRLFRARMHSYT